MSISGAPISGETISGTPTTTLPSTGTFTPPPIVGPQVSTTLTNKPSGYFSKRKYREALEGVRKDAVVAQRALWGFTRLDLAERDLESNLDIPLEEVQSRLDGLRHERAIEDAKERIRQEIEKLKGR